MSGNLQQAGVPKEVVIKVPPNMTHYQIYFKTGGEVPKSIQGLYTSKALAERAVQNWRADKAPKQRKMSTA